MNFLFDSIYQIVTWVLIAGAIGFLLLFFSKENWQGVLWSACALVCFVVVMLCLLAQKHYPIFWRSRNVSLPSASEPLPSPSPSARTRNPENHSITTSKPVKLVGGEASAKRPQLNTSPPYYADLNAPKWTDYTEDYFCGAIWRWGYRPEMPGQTPRNIGGYCPDCGCGLRATNLLYPDPNGDGDRYLFDCPLNDHRFYVRAVSADPYEGVKRQIQEKLKDRDYWEAVVIRQREAQKGRRI